MGIGVAFIQQASAGQNGLTGGTRTPDLQLRRLLLYPVELQSDLVGRLGVEPSTNGL